ncbi:hypothetical protein ASPBRDRAFT_76852 [Aspergillus brasiliensis CBS 101740]|uniref:Aminoglycoside phosphotransferase domain-containing protein n=1 Tax=Aspergillus brasiliensis (strain CBS 101740 / IMI 381727 / IBT 21946) TaxID=767769 RepID=A0A1L9UCQ3_ASPBC|nr:hypothetical protein ASPBRDRAFT_76852 [Aspergillus brasiliensis CBS 101740]
MSSTKESVDCTPQVDVQYTVPNFEVPYPDDIRKMLSPSNTIFNWGGVKIAKISSEMVVKFGAHVTLTEAKNMIFVEQHTKTVPVPKIFAYYTHGPFNRNIDDYGSLYDTYIFMSFVGSQTLNKAWGTYDSTTKARIAVQLKEYINELLQIGNGNGNYIGSVGPGPVTDPILENYFNKGPFNSEDDFNRTLVEAYQAQAPKRHIKSFLTGMLSEREHRIVFTHGDLRHANIMVNDNGKVTGIVDWEFSGWYPEYWEFAKALYVWRWQNDWTDYLLQCLEPYYPEYTAHSFMAATLW